MKPKFLRIVFLILRSLYRLLPRRSKRTMFLTSLYFYLVKEGLFRNVSLRQFSQMADIDMSSAGMRLPLEAKDLIWKPTNVVSAVQEEYSHCPLNAIGNCPTWDRARELSETIVNSTPAWMRYEREAMVKDCIRLFYH